MEELPAPQRAQYVQAMCVEPGLVNRLHAVHEIVDVVGIVYRAAQLASIVENLRDDLASLLRVLEELVLENHKPRQVLLTVGLCFDLREQDVRLPDLGTQEHELTRCANGVRSS